MRLFNKLLWVCAVVLFATPAAFSQDIIVLKDKASDEIQVKVLEVTKKSVTYKKWSYQDGPTFTLDVDKILAIKYQNGEMQTFVKEKKSDSKEKSTKKREDKKVVDASTPKTVDTQVVKADDTSQIYSLSRSQTTSPAASTTATNNVAAASTVSESVSTPKSPELPAKLQSTKLYSAGDFVEYGVSYFAPFEEPGTGFYMVGSQMFFGDKGFGAEFRVGFNFGLVDSEYASSIFLIGPSYGYAINENIAVSTSLNFLGAYSNDEFNCGAAFMPKVTLKFGKVLPWFGVNASYGAGADDVAFGFQVGVGFAL